MSVRPGSASILALLAFVLACGGSAPQPVTRPEPSQPTPPPAPVAAVARPPLPLPPPPIRPAPTPEVPTGPLVLRVGLATDLAAVTLPCCDADTVVELGDQPWDAGSTITVKPAGSVVERVVYRLQVAALKDENQARGIAEYLTKAGVGPAEAIFDAGTDLYRVRVGRYPSREDAETDRGQLAALGVIESWVVSEGGDIKDPALRVVRGEEERIVAGRWIDVTDHGEDGIRVLDRRYRGKILVYLNDRGLLNVVNEIDLEEYLRGVVPMEMGPELYDELEVLKAQAVAARTYAVRQLDTFAFEGYDICSTPRCQVYGGMGVEHPTSDKAVRETRGQVVLAVGKPAETFYSATCGGHTENVEVVFPLKRGSYLRGVPCIEAGVETIHGMLPVGTPFPAGLTRRLLPPSALAKEHRVLSARIEHLALLAGLPVARDRLRSTSSDEVRRFVTSVFDLALDRRLLAGGEDLRRLLADPPPEWGLRDRRLAGFLVEGGLPAKARALTAGEVETLLFELAVYLGVLRHEQTHFLAVADGRLTVRDGAERRAQQLSSPLATFRRRGPSLIAADLELMAGDRLDFYWHDGGIVALAQPVEAAPVTLDRLHAPHQSWRRFKTRQQVASTVQERYPGFPFEGFEILSRGVSGRVGRLKLLGAGERSLVVEGLAVRWTLDLHDTLFEVRAARSEAGVAGWVFRGRGWGHGVGMCQAGAYAMALRGSDYRSILEHYYTGIELGRLKPVPQRPRLAS
ncbi:MAG: SpoIID/LytB domain-containing protein [Thermoanaerobaculia bacterium]